MTQYFNVLTRRWQQLETLKGFGSYDWDCPSDAARYQMILEKNRTFKFQLRLYKSLDEICGRVLGTKSLPYIKEVFSEA